MSRRSPCTPVEQTHLLEGVSPRRRATLALVSTLAALGALAFTAAPALAASQTVKVTIVGHGSVSASEGEISDCTEAGGSSCEGEYEEGSVVTLTADPETANRFVGWTGCDAEPGPVKCELQMTAAKSVHAEFTPAPPSRSFETLITGGSTEGEPRGIAVDSADNVWVTASPGFSYTQEIDKFAPDGTLLFGGTPAGFPGATGSSGVAFSDASGHLYMTSDRDNTPNFVLNLDGTVYSTINPNPLIPGKQLVSADNSPGVTGGDLYFNRDSEGPITRVDSSAEPAPFSASASYIGGERHNQLTGSPAGSYAAFQSVRFTTVDADGNLYVTNPRLKVIEEFAPSGLFIRKFTGEGAPGGFSGGLVAVAVDPTNGNILVTDGGTGAIDVFDAAGNYLEQLTGAPGEPFGGYFGGGIAVNSQGYVYVAVHGKGVYEFTPSDVAIPKVTYGPVEDPTHTSATLTATVEPTGSGEEVVSCHFEYGEQQGNYTLGTLPCLNVGDTEVGTKSSPIISPTEIHAGLSGLTGETTYHYRLVAANSSRARYGGDRQYTPHNVAGLSTDPATEVLVDGASFNGSLDPEGHHTSYRFEYTTEGDFKAHGYATAHTAPVPDADAGEGAGEAPVPSIPVTGLASDTTYVYRIVATNGFGTTFGESQAFTTFQPPTIEAVSSSHVTATSAELEARFNPQSLPAGVEAECSFEYGTTNSYGSVEPCAEPLESTTPQQIKLKIEDLQQGATYHFRFRAESKWGAVTSEDQTFEFFPPDCPNSAVRQQTGSAYLPDCRAYELVSPGNANGTLLFAGGPNPGTATSPSRFSFVGLFSALPGQDVIGTAGDLYVATRTNTGWVSHYIGLPGSQSACVGGPPTNPINNSPSLPRIQNSVLTDPAMSRFLDWNDGTGNFCLIGGNSATGDFNDPIDPASDAPYLWGADGGFLAHLPSALASTPGAAAALTCPGFESAGNLNGGVTDHAEVSECSGEVTASGDLNRLFFSSRSLSFSEPGEPAGLTAAPGSAYEEDLSTGKVTLISHLPGGADIPQDPGFASAARTDVAGEPFSPGGPEEFLRFPAVSTDGSHVLISTNTTKTAGCRESFHSVCDQYTNHPIHLYMHIRTGGAPGVTREISVNQLTHENAGVTYLGMTPDGSKVFFTSEEQLIEEDKDSSTDLYMWSQKGEEEGLPLTLISKADNEGNAGEPGNTDSCAALTAKIRSSFQGEEREAPWTTKCGVIPWSGYSYSFGADLLGGNGISDSAIPENGDIYFYSPEQLDGDRGVLNQQNLYVYRDGRARYVTTFTPRTACRTYPHFDGLEFDCAESPIARFEVTPNDTRAAFLTPDRLTSYDNAGHLELYSYTPSTGAIVCDSCNPDGRPATADVSTSQDGRFLLTDDGRAFFSTEESLVPADTNEGADVYEFVGGRPQLISPGTGTATLTAGTFVSNKERPGLIGVSADGTDVYFSTFDTLLPAEDHNGNFMKFYDARTNGGISQPPPVQPCAAAEECHGPGTEPPTLPTQGTAATLAGGNADSRSHHARKHHKKDRHRRRRHRSAHHNRRAVR